MSTPYELADAQTLRESLGKHETRYGSGDFEYNILFQEDGYTPHQVNNQEALDDWADSTSVGEDTRQGDEILFMCDPHTAEAAFIYNLRTGQIEWEFEITGSGGAHPNPHQGFILPEDISNLGSKGDVCCTDKDKNIIVVDRQDQSVKLSEQVQDWNPGLLHAVHLAVDNNLITTDYQKGRIDKIDTNDFTSIWTNDGPKVLSPGKISTIKSRNVRHNTDFGGEYLIGMNREKFEGRILEIRDSDGTNTWSSGGSNSFTKLQTHALVQKTHRAIRVHRSELKGPITVTHSESEGTIMAINWRSQPVWQVGGNSLLDDGTTSGLRYHSNPEGLGEVTEVFESVRGRIGFSSWYGENSALVGEILRLPQKQTLHWGDPTGRQSKNSFELLNPVNVSGWDGASFLINNRGGNDMDWELLEWFSPVLDVADMGIGGSLTEDAKVVEDSGTLSPGNKVRVETTGKSVWAALQVKATTTDDFTTFDVFVTKWRG
ncbi:hypothetical protein BRD56_05425 [Thermoplasmatales archaeon SW_10_69_26]|nr:MAG: hypothetical protein BRD56_05425 [Thermoplasmatales archaeon SW_10_69_26]